MMSSKEVFLEELAKKDEQFVDLISVYNPNGDLLVGLHTKIGFESQ